jgi:hypothetical protein
VILHTDVDKLLAIRIRERSDLLDRIVEGLRRDRHVRAAWLYGSVSRGEDDALSDLDLSVVVSDESIGEFVANRRVHAAEPDYPVLLMDDVANAPVGGAFLLSLYAGEAGPQQVDWSWQPESGEGIPDDEMVLFNVMDLPLIPGDDWRRQVLRSPGPRLEAGASIGDQLTQKIEFSWVISAVVAKYIARRDGETAARLMRLIARTLSEAAQMGNTDAALAGHDETLDANLASAGGGKQFDVLEGLVRDAGELGDRLVERGAILPSGAIAHIVRFFELTKAMVARDP